MKIKIFRNVVCLFLAVALFFCPCLSFNVYALSPPDLTGTVYDITNAEELTWISDVCSGKVKKGTMNYPSNPSFSGYTFVLKNDISLGTIIERDGEYVLKSGNVWTPIGTEETPFSGIFNGNEFSVKGVFAIGETSPSGFFGVVENGSIGNLTVKGYVSGLGVAGGIAGRVSGEIRGCVFDGLVDGAEKTGGIVGEVIGTADTKSVLYLNAVAGEVVSFSGSSCGGIAGYGENTDISSCSVGGGVYSQSKYTGGIVGLSGNGVTVDGCSVNCRITADGDVAVTGGIIGEAKNTLITNNSFLGDVYSGAFSQSLCGGIAGSFLGKIENSFVNGGVHSSNFLSDKTGEKVSVSAGIVAKATGGEISNCYFSGISENNGLEGYEVCPENSVVLDNVFYSVGEAYGLCGYEETFSTLGIIDELKSWISSKSGYSSWQIISGVNDTKPLLKHKNATWSDDSRVWKIEDTVFTYYGEGEMDDYEQNQYGIIDTPWAVYRTTARTVNIKEGVTRIGNNAFLGFDNLRTLSLPSTLKEIGDFAFEQCVYLKNFAFPTGLEDIGEGAFRWCKALTSVTLPKNIRSVRNRTFAHCEKLSSVSIPNSVSFIGYMAFAMCDSLVNVTVPESVREIDNYAFYYCDKLTTVKFPKMLNRIGAYAFGRCDLLINFDIPDNTLVEEEAFWSMLPKGDVDNDGEISALDYLKIKSYFLGRETLTKAEIKVSDCDFDGTITSADYLCVRIIMLNK